MNFLIANYGNESIALIEWARSIKLEQVIVLSVDTGWHSDLWQKHLTGIFNYLSENSIQFEHLKPQKEFADSVIDRGSFPSVKFQWCAPFLKGLPLNDAMDRLDINGEANIYLPKMKAVSKANKLLISGEESEHYQNRVVNYPLLDMSIAQRDQLIEQSGLDVLSHRSDECMPCIHAKYKDEQRMSYQDKQKLLQLEKHINQKMFSHPLTEHHEVETHYDMGCGNVWGCGE